MISTNGIQMIKSLIIIILGSLIGLLIFISYMNVDPKYHEVIFTSKNYIYITTNSKYLIDTPSCKIPFVHPFNEEVERFYKPNSYTQCSEKPLLSYIAKNESNITLNINQTLLPSYSSFKISCCYSTITRRVIPDSPEDHINYSDCTFFEESVSVEEYSVVMVTCRNFFFLKVYSNVHAIINRKLVAAKKSSELPNHNSSFSVLLVGIDGISKLNFMRTMPRTLYFLQKKNFIDLKGYTKIGYNTIPNLFGVLAGVTKIQAEKYCDVDNFIDNCSLIWKDFKRSSYVTGYGEDSSSLGTFNYDKKGFRSPPTDFYFRPYILATENLKIMKISSMFYCTGPENSGERIMNLIKDFQITLKDYRKFGLFWMNSFSHDDLNLPSAMDEKVDEFLNEIYPHLDDTFLFFFSDHGFRFGDIRNTQTGWLEERIPYSYVHVPESFKQRFPEMYKNIKMNSERLTTPFDVFMTLQHILYLSDRNFAVQESIGCPKCHTLFSEISNTRICPDAGIDQNWCVCNALAYINPKDRIVQEAAVFLVNTLNKLVQSFAQGKKCYPYKLVKVYYSAIVDFTNEENKTETNLLLRFRTIPYTKWESTVELISNNSKPEFRFNSDFSRLTKYANSTNCIKNAELEKYCFCIGHYN